MENNKQSSSNKFYLGFITFVIIVLSATLPFHYVIYYDEFKVFPKDNLSFRYTFVTESDVDNLIERYNEANLFEKLDISNESLSKKLIESGIIEKEKR